MFKSCESNHEIKIVQVENKYGIGYEEDDMIVPAEYDKVYHLGGNNLWGLYNEANKSYGLAYVTDSVHNVLPPVYEEIKDVGYHTDVAYAKKGDDYWFIYQGEKMNDEPFRSIEPVYGMDDKGYVKGRTMPSFIVKDKDGHNSLVNNKCIPRINEKFRYIIEDRGDILRVKGMDDLYRLYKTDGSLVTNKKFYYLMSFSDGIAWTSLTKSDFSKSKWSVIDKKGNVLFTKNDVSAYSPTIFTEGISFYRPKKDYKDYVAVNKAGDILFKIEASEIQPYTLGLAPVVKGPYNDRKLGFIDKKGKVVIPFKYDYTYSKTYQFGSDSLMSVSLNGANGKLHRNGTFTMTASSKTNNK